MATDGPDPKPCDWELFMGGACVAMSHTYGACHFEGLIVQLRQELGVPVDWHYVGGFARVLTWPEHAERVKAAFEANVVPEIKKITWLRTLIVPQTLAAAVRELGEKVSDDQ